MANVEGIRLIDVSYRSVAASVKSTGPIVLGPWEGFKMVQVGFPVCEAVCAQGSAESRCCFKNVFHALAQKLYLRHCVLEHARNLICLCLNCRVQSGVRDPSILLFPHLMNHSIAAVCILQPAPLLWK